MKLAGLVFVSVASIPGFGQTNALPSRPAQLGAWSRAKTISWRFGTPRGIDAVGDAENDVIHTQDVRLSDDGNTLIYNYQEVTIDTRGNYSPVESKYQFSVPLQDVTVADPERDPRVSPVTVVYSVKLNCWKRTACIVDNKGRRQNALWLVFSSAKEANSAAGELASRLEVMAAQSSTPATR